MNRTLIISLTLALSLVACATENYITHADTRIDPIVRERLEDIDDILANHVIGPLTKTSAGAYTPSIVCGAGSDDIVFISTEVVYLGYITDADATAEIAAFTNNFTSFDTIETGLQANLLVEWAADTFYVTQGAANSSLETSIIPNHTKGRVPLAIVNIKTTSSVEWSPGDDWDKTSVATVVHNCYAHELEF